MRLSRIWRILRTEIFNNKNKNNQQKCRVLVWVFLQTFRAWHFISGVNTKYVGNVAMFAYAMKETNIVVCAACTRPRGKRSRSIARMTGAKLKNKAHLQALPLHVFPAEHNSANWSVVDRATSCVKMFRDRETRQVFLYASKALLKTLS